MKIALLGFGNVGTAVWKQLSGRSDIVIKKVLTRSPAPMLGALAAQSFEEILDDPEISTVVELIGGIEPAFSYCARALSAGKNVVTANALMLSYRLKPLTELAVQNGVCLKLDPAMGGIPFLHNLVRVLQNDMIRSVFGISNGTTNLILDTMQTVGGDFDTVLAQAQRLGYTEADPNADIGGLDARSKLCVAASIAFGRFIDPDGITVCGIRSITRGDTEMFRKLGFACRLIVRGERSRADAVSAFVEPMLLPSGSLEAAVTRGNGMLGWLGDRGGMQYFFGPSAGRDPVALAVTLALTDLLCGDTRMEACCPAGGIGIDNSAVAHRYYVRTSCRMSLPAEKLRSTMPGQNVYLTSPVGVDRMHALAASLRMRDPDLFFAGIRG